MVQIATLEKYICCRVYFHKKWVFWFDQNYIVDTCLNCKDLQHKWADQFAISFQVMAISANEQHSAISILAVQNTYSLYIDILYNELGWVSLYQCCCSINQVSICAMSSLNDMESIMYSVCVRLCRTPIRYHSQHSKWRLRQMP